VVRADRLLALLLLLQAKGRTTASRLAAELEVSVRTVYRDLEALAAAGVPVYAESGPGGGCQLLPGWRSPLDGLSPDEADALLILGIPAPLRQLGLGAPAESAQRQVGRAAGRRGGAGPAPVLVHLDMPRWFHAGEKTPHVAELAGAVRQRKKACLGYRSPGASSPKVHLVEPLGLVNKAGVWYLVATNSRGTVVLRVSRVASVEVSAETFRRPAAFDLERFWTGWSEEFVSKLPQVPVTVRVSPRGMAVLPEVFGEAVGPLIEAAGPPDGDGWREMTLSFERPEVAAYRLVALGNLIEVVEPVEVRRHIVDVAVAALEVYRVTPATRSTRIPS